MEEAKDFHKDIRFHTKKSQSRSRSRSRSRSYERLHPRDIPRRNNFQPVDSFNKTDRSDRYPPANSDNNSTNKEREVKPEYYSGRNPERFSASGYQSSGPEYGAKDSAQTSTFYFYGVPLDASEEQIRDELVKRKLPCPKDIERVKQGILSHDME